MSGRGARLGLPVVAAVVALGAWAALASQLNPVLLPGPVSVVQAAWSALATSSTIDTTTRAGGRPYLTAARLRLVSSN